MQVRLKFALWAVALSMTASGCTTHLATQVDNLAEPQVQGIPYRLPKRQITVEARWMLDSCATSGQKVAIEFKSDASFTEDLVEGERLAIDYQHMTNRFKTGQVDVTYWKIGEGAAARQTGFIKTVNSEIKGEEAAAIKAGIGAAASAAKLVLSLSGALPPPVKSVFKGQLQDVPKIICNPDLFDKGDAGGKPGAITTLKAGEIRLKEIASEVEAATTKLALIKTRTLGNLSAADQAEFDRLNSKVEAFAAEKKTIDGAAALFRQLYGTSRKIAWTDFSKSDALPPELVADPSAERIKLIQPEDDKLAKLALKALTCNPAANLTAQQCATELANLGGLLALQLATPAERAKQSLLASIDLPDAGYAGSSPLTDGASLAGLVYREPVDGRFWLSRPEITGVQVSEKLADKTVSFPQLGRVVVLPLRSRFAEKNGLSAEFDPDGRPSRLSYKAIEAGGAAALEALKQGLDEAGGIVGSVRAEREARKAEEEGAQLAALKDQIALLTEQQKLAELSKSPDPEAAAREAELQLLRFEKERAELRKAIAAAALP